MSARILFFTDTEVAALGGSGQADALAAEQFWTCVLAFLQPTPRP